MNAMQKPTIQPEIPAGASTSPVSINVRRRIAAPAGDLFAAWLDPARVAQWLRPGSTVKTDARIDAVVGGSFQIDMHQPDKLVPHRGTYVEIDPPRRLVFTWASPHTAGRDTLVTVEFIEVDGATEVSLTHEQLPEYMAAGHTGGWSSGLEKLATHVEG
jgi:uncharacterized protein YndB with AHSA1/START domain